eukprot:12785723-Alexandrium_andersonii.AAC.1
MVKSLLAKLDAWTWPEDLGWQVKYYSAVATTANVWRSTGIRGKLEAAAAKEFGDFVASCHFQKLPGKPLRGRWGSIDQIELKLKEGREYLGRVFRLVFSTLDTRGAGKKR